MIRSFLYEMKKGMKKKGVDKLHVAGCVRRPLIQRGMSVLVTAKGLNVYQYIRKGSNTKPGT